MERHDDEQPEGEYPSAPVPPHERGWRHPSEVGASQWTATEPPLALGRGLMAATATIGVLLAGGLVWAMLPASGAPLADTASTLTIAGATATIAPATTVPPPTTDAPAPATTAISATTTTAPPTAPTPVLAITDAPAAVATSVVVGEQIFLVTTAAAIGDRQRVLVAGQDGTATTATLVWADESLAVLAAPAAAVTASLATGSMPAPGTGVSVMSASGEVGTGVLAGSSIDGVLTADLAEGTPVLDPSGKVVGLCSGDQVVPVALPDEVLALLAELRGWMGLRLAGGDDAEPVVVGTEPGSPADVAGLLDGDVIVDVDGRSVTTIAELRWLLARHLPGDVLVVEVMRDGRPLGGIEVTLAGRPTNL